MMPFAAETAIDLFLITKVLGHSAQKTTELYAHFQPDYLRGAVEVLAQATRPNISPHAFTTQPEMVH